MTPTRARRPSPPTRRFARLAPFPANPARASRPPRATSASDAADDEKKTDASSSSSRAASTAAGFDAVRVESLTVAQLRAVLRSRGARVGGNKSELAARVAAGGTVTADALVVMASDADLGVAVPADVVGDVVRASGQAGVVPVLSG